MGAAGARRADVVIVTDDNPRTEDAQQIRAQVLAGCPGALEIGDRAKAINRAVASLAPNDLLMIAGKGHESGQTIGEDVTPFVDADVARAAVTRITGESDTASTEAKSHA